MGDGDRDKEAEPADGDDEADDADGEDEDGMPMEGSRTRGKGGLNSGWRSGGVAEEVAAGAGRGAVAA